MMIDKEEYKQVLHLLKNLEENLMDIEDDHLKNSLKKLIEVLQSDLFGALVDIQMSYEVMVENGGKKRRNTVQFYRNK